MDDAFLRMVVVVTATLMGFAFLGPLIQAASSKFFTGRERYFKSMVIYIRILSHKSFALFIFFWPFLSSSLLLINQDSQIEKYIRILSMTFALVLLLWYWKGIMPTIVRPETVNDIFNRSVRIAMIAYFCYAGAACFYQSFDLFFQTTVIVFTVFGLVFIMDSLLTPIGNAIFFRVKDKVIDSELDSEYKEEVKECFRDIENALSNAKKQLQRLEGLHLPPNNEVERHRNIARYQSEIAFLSRHFDGPKGLKQEWEKEIISKRERTYAHLSAFNEKKEKVLVEILPEFERVTKEIELLLEKLSEQHESDE